MEIKRTVLVAFGVMKGVDLFNQVVHTDVFPLQPGPRSPSPTTKSLCALALAVAGACAAEDDWWERAVLAAGAAGLAGVIHEGQTLVEIIGAYLVTRRTPRSI